MRIKWVDFICGFFVCLVMASYVVVRSSDERYAIIIKAHQEGKIVCNNVGDEFICREVQK